APLLQRGRVEKGKRVTSNVGHGACGGGAAHEVAKGRRRKAALRHDRAIVLGFGARWVRAVPRRDYAGLPAMLSIWLKPRIAMNSGEVLAAQAMGFRDAKIAVRPKGRHGIHCAASKPPSAASTSPPGASRRHARVAQLRQPPSDPASCKPLHAPEQRREHAHVHLRMLAHRPVIMAIPWSRLPAHCNDLLQIDRKSTRLNSSHVSISYAVFCV